MELKGGSRTPERPGMREALRALTLRKGPPTEADRPPPSTLPLTPAAKEALRLKRKRA
jgi:hypothetical protein